MEEKRQKERKGGRECVGDQAGVSIDLDELPLEFERLWPTVGP